MRFAAAIPALALIGGAAAGLGCPGFPRPLGLALLAASVFGGLGAFWWRRPWLLVATAAAAFSSGGVLLASDAWRDAWRPSLRVEFETLARQERAQAALEHRAVPEDEQAFAVVTGILRSDAAAGPSGVTLAVDVDAIEVDGHPRNLSGGVQATVAGTLAAERIGAWRGGRRVRMPVQLHRPGRYLNTGVPDSERALARRGITLVGSVKSGALVDVIARGSLPDESMAALRAFSRSAIDAAVGPWSPRSAAIVAAIVIGDRAGLDPDVQRSLQEAGTYHVIAISGGNIAILAGLLLGAFRLAGLLGRAALLAAIVMLVAYADFVGGGASVDRATLMAVVAFAGRVLDHRSPPLNSLAVVAALLVATAPLSVADPAFVLTFGATLAILIAVPLVSQFVNRGTLRTMATLGAASAATELMLFPVGAIFFSRITFAGLALNFAAIPMMGVAQVAGMAIPPLAAVSPGLARWSGLVAHVGAAGLVVSASLVRFAPMLSYRVAPPSWPWISVYYGGLTVAWLLWRRRARWGGSREERAARWIRRGSAAAAVASALWILLEPWTLAVNRGDGRLHVTFIDVGQGDSAFLRFPSGSTLLVDAGGLPGSAGFDIGDRVVAPVLRDAGVRRLDLLALTHGDPDHIGGATSILREFRPGEILEGIPVPRFEPLQRLRAEAVDLRLTWTTVKQGDHRMVDGVEIVVRHPPIAEWERQRVRNDDSIVLDVRWFDVSVLLTGDIGKATERPLAASIARAPLEVLKVPHHGSLTSSTPELVRAAAPRVAVISVGRANHFGHPAPEVLQRYREVGAEIFRTDRDGAVTLETDGHSLTVRSFNGRTFRF